MSTANLRTLPGVELCCPAGAHVPDQSRVEGFRLQRCDSHVALDNPDFTTSEWIPVTGLALPGQPVPRHALRIGGVVKDSHPGTGSVGLQLSARARIDCCSKAEGAASPPL